MASDSKHIRSDDFGVSGDLQLATSDKVIWADCDTGERQSPNQDRSTQNTA
jgi:hypothetical protein